MTTDEKRISFVGMNIQQAKKQLTEQEDLLNPISRQSILPQTEMIRKELEELGPLEELSDSLLFKLDTLSKELFKIKQKVIFFFGFYYLNASLIKLTSGVSFITSSNLKTLQISIKAQPRYQFRH